MANAKHVEILQQGIKVWNAWRKEHPRIKPDLSTFSLHGADLRGINFSKTYLENSDLGKANCTEANFQDAYLYNTDACKATFDKAVLKNANLQRAIFRQARLRNAKLDLAVLYQADFGQADLTRASLGGADLKDANFEEAILKGANFNAANLDGTNLSVCDLSRCTFDNASMVNARMANSNLTGVNLWGHTLAGAVFWRANLSHADLSETDCQNVEFAEANLRNANLSLSNFDTVEFREADLTNADLHGSYLGNASLVRAIVEGANFQDCCVYGTAAWDLVGTPRLQKDLIITPDTEPEITVDDLEVAQFVYLVSNNKKIRNFMNAFAEKNVLILGRFARPERKAVLDGLREHLRAFDLVPIVFDFESPQDKDFTETVQTLAGMSMFVIVDVTNPKSTPLEMEATVKQFKIPYVPILDTSADERAFAMMVDLQKSFHWVLPTFGYRSKEELFRHLKVAVIDRALQKHTELREQKAKAEISLLTIEDLLKVSPKGKRERKLQPKIN